MLENKWRLVGSFNWIDTSKKATPFAISHRFRSRLVKTYTSSPGLPRKWRRSGYLSVVSSVSFDGKELANFVVPINATKIFPMPLVTGFYQLIFQPVNWLPKGLRFQVFEYAGSEPDQRLINELIFLR